MSTNGGRKGTTWPKGVKRERGRPPGTPNKSTRHAREAIALFVDKQSQRLETLLSEIEAEDGAQAAWKCIMDLIEYHVPKLQRVEHTGEDGGPINVYVKDPTRP